MNGTMFIALFKSLPHAT